MIEADDAIKVIDTVAKNLMGVAMNQRIQTTLFN
jgi:hypothetical protein